jgi:hypothetical protein
MEEIWKIIKDFEDYEVSNMGNVRKIGCDSIVEISTNDSGRLCARLSGPLVQHAKASNGDGSLIQLAKASKSTNKTIHLLVANAFIPKSDPKHTNTIHIDKNVKNNCVDNLKWCTAADVTKFNNELRKKGIISKTEHTIKLEEKAIESSNTWKPVKGYKEYEVSNSGVIRREGKTINQYKNGNGTFVVDLYRSNYKDTRTVGFIVASAFISNPNKLKKAGHKDGNKLNNNVGNLYWIKEAEKEEEFDEHEFYTFIANNSEMFKSSVKIKDVYKKYGKNLKEITKFFEKNGKCKIDEWIIDPEDYKDFA